MDSPTQVPDLWERIQGYFRPASLLFLGVYYYFLTLLESPLLLLTDFEKFKHESFSKLWLKYGAAMSEMLPPGSVELIATTKGVVLDLGPGSGTQLHLFDSSKIQKVYAIEPAVKLHQQLKQAAEENELGSKYEILAAGAEPRSLIPTLAKAGVLGSTSDGGTGIFDTIVSIRVLCGVPHHEETIRTLHHLLKPGGRILLVEHVKQPYPNGGDLIAAIMQRVYMLAGWWLWLGGCCVDRDTEAVLRKAAGPRGWKEVKIKQLNTFAALPYIVGEMVKA